MRRRTLVLVTVVGLTFAGAAVNASADAPTNACDTVYTSNTIAALKAYTDCRDDRIEKQLTQIQRALPSTPSPGPSVTPTISASPTPTPTKTPSPMPSVTPTPTPSPTVSAGQILFQDDFTGTGTYDHGKWGEWSGCTFNSAAYYGNIKCGDRSSLDGQGHLSIPATPDTGTSISTKDDFTFTYGTVTARVKVQTQAGYWPAFWTLSGPPNGSDTPLGGELDAMEAFTQANDGYRVAAHNYVNGADQGPHDNPLCGGQDVRGTYHDYGMRVEPGKVTFLFDGAACFSFTSSHPDLVGKPYAFGPNARNWLLLTNAVGNASQGMNPPTQPSALLVDRVEVRAL